MNSEMKLIIASNNANKLIEIKEILGDTFPEIMTMKEAGIEHETVEDGTTFEENAIKKAREAAEISGCCALADDSGLCVEALDGAPGIYSARFCGYHGDDKKNRDVLLEKLNGVTDRKAYFICAMALVTPSGKCITAEGRFYGEITEEEKGENGFGYDCLFYVPEYGCTSAEMSPELKNSMSHRKAALTELLKKINETEFFEQ